MPATECLTDHLTQAALEITRQNIEQAAAVLDAWRTKVETLLPEQKEALKTVNTYNRLPFALEAFTKGYTIEAVILGPRAQELVKTLQSTDVKNPQDTMVDLLKTPGEESIVAGVAWYQKQS